MNKSPHFSQQIQPKQSGLKLRKYVPIHQKTDLITEVKVYLKIILLGSMLERPPLIKQQYLEIVKLESSINQ